MTPLTAPEPWLLALALPLLVAAALTTARLRPAALALAPWAGVPLIGLLVLTPIGTRAVAPRLLFGAALEVDAIGRSLGLLTLAVWLCAGLSARGYRAAQAPLQGFALLAGTGMLALLIAADLVTLYAGFALLSFAGYGLIVGARAAGDRADEAREAGRVYVVFAVLAELLVFAGLILAAAEAESLRLPPLRGAIATSPRAALITGLLLAGFGVKASVLFLHPWTPLAYAAAPIPGAALLGGALVNAGLLGWLRVLPLGLVGQPTLARIVTGAGVIAAFYGVLIGLVQRRSEHLLAYSSVSQMGLITVAVALGLADADHAAVAAGVALWFAVHHGTSKAALFLLLGALRRPDLDRRARAGVELLFALVGLGLAGAPLTSGAIAKHELERLIHTVDPAVIGGWAELLPALLSGSSVATTVLVLRLLVRARDEARIARSITGPAPGRRAAIAPAVVLALLALASLWLAAGWQAPSRAGAVATRSGLWASAWPPLLGLASTVTAVGLWRRLPRDRWPSVSVPPGDLLIPARAALVGIDARARRWGRSLAEAVEPIRARAEAVGERLRTTAERLLARPPSWTLSALLLLALLLALAGLVLVG